MGRDRICNSNGFIGWKILDIGCNAGFYSVELAKRGGIVTAIYIDTRYLVQGEWVVNKFVLQNQIRLKNMQVYDLAHYPNTYDLVWFMGVFYHLRYPFLALDIVSRICRNLMVFQTMTLPATVEYDNVKNISLFNREIMNQPGWPRMAFVEGCIADDPTNWWVPTHTAVVAILRASGFKVLSRPSDEVYVCQRDGTFIDTNDLREMEYRAATGCKK